MSAEPYSFIPEIIDRRTRHSFQRSARLTGEHKQESFRCKFCHSYVHNIPELSGVHNRNHCPYCLHSRHLDLAHPGDRLSACKGAMQPIGLTVKPGRNKYASANSGELMLIHQCRECGAISLNRIASDDTPDGLLTVLKFSQVLCLPLLHQLSTLGVHLLEANDAELVTWQLFGKIEN